MIGVTNDTLIRQIAAGLMIL